MVRSETSSEGLVTISLDRPDKANALTPGMLEALIAAVEAATTAGARALVLTGTGFLIALVAWLPLALQRLPLSLPIVCIGLGLALFSVPQVGPAPLPLAYPEITERLTEFVVIIALMGAGLKIDRIFNPRRWGVTWRLLGVTMMLSIAALMVIAPRAIPGLPASFRLASLALLAVPIVSVLLFLFHSFSWTGAELVIALGCFAWLVLFIRTTNAVINEESVRGAS